MSVKNPPRPGAVRVTSDGTSVGSRVEVLGNDDTWIRLMATNVTIAIDSSSEHGRTYATIVVPMPITGTAFDAGTRS